MTEMRRVSERVSEFFHVLNVEPLKSAFSLTVVEEQKEEQVCHADKHSWNSQETNLNVCMPPVSVVCNKV